MKCKILKTSERDVAAFVTKDAFMANVDMDDLGLRKSEEIFDWYHPKWFHHSDNNELYFIPPAFWFNDGHLRGINGRHRALLLCRHMEVIPMLLVLSHEWPKNKLTEIMFREIGENEIVNLPDLKVKAVELN